MKALVFRKEASHSKDKNGLGTVGKLILGLWKLEVSLSLCLL